ncbi:MULTISPECIES: translation initiation factor IF-3 [unclassified Rhodococcus (in: high G+C Gram-positive bacteria)]|uniref:translation initiation factor IF-3 n=1 Tax=Rhodococcus sp. SJ-3 TaxID=3454628 RepID=UPI003F78BAEE
MPSRVWNVVAAVPRRVDRSVRTPPGVSALQRGFFVEESPGPACCGAVRKTTPHFYLGGPISAETRINERIRVPEVRLVGPGGEQVGIVRVEDALRLAIEADLDLVEVAPDARPPVCKIMDYGKFKYEAAQKARESRKNQQLTVIKEQKLRPKIDDHDYETKKKNVVRFLEAGSKVKVTIMFRGREQSRPELGFRLLQRLGADVADLGFIETSAKQDGRNMTMVLAPHKGAKTRAKAQEAAHAAPAKSSRPAPAVPAEPAAPAAQEQQDQSGEAQTS